jgi:hypothetical protein
MQDPDFCADAGMNPETMVDELGSVLAKYEVPMGLMNKVWRSWVVKLLWRSFGFRFVH